MYNELFHIGPFTVYGYGLMIGIGIVVAYFTAEKRAKKRGLDPERIFGFVISCVIAGFAGSKILYTITTWDRFINDPASLFREFFNGWVVYGGIIGGIVGALIYCKVCKLNALKYIDNAFPSVAFGQAFGRIGCFLAGCCYGRECAGPLSVTFKNSHFAPNNIPLIPTQLIMSAADFILAFGLIFLYDKKFKKPGQTTAFYLIFYSMGRFLIEYLRGDLDRGNVGIFSTSQFIAIFTFIAGVAGLILATRFTRDAAVEKAEEEEVTTTSSGV